jgi:hypothetical protein
MKQDTKNRNLAILIGLFFLVAIIDWTSAVAAIPFPFIGPVSEAGVNTVTESLQAGILLLIVALLK